VRWVWSRLWSFQVGGCLAAPAAVGGPNQVVSLDISRSLAA
jgi:hypothetical protein